MPAICQRCGEEYSSARHVLGYDTCLKCGEHKAREVKHTIVPMHKSNYIPVTDRDILKQLNKVSK